MKKGVKVIFIFIILIVLTACGSSDLNMTIDSDGYVTLTHTILVDKEEFNNLNDIIKQDQDTFTYNGYNVEKIIDNDMIGYKMSKQIGSLSANSLNSNQTIELTEYGKSDFNDLYMFKYKKHFLTDKYVASFLINLTDVDNAVRYLPIMGNTAYSSDANDENGVTSSTVNTSSINELSKNTTATFTLDSSINISKNNADIVKDGKYTWNLTYGKVNEIYFEVNKLNVGMIITCIFLIVVGVSIYLFIRFRNNRMRSYANVSIRDSLDLEYNKEKKSEYRDIKMRSKYKVKDESFTNNASKINERLSGSSSSLGAYTNTETLDKLNSRLSDTSSRTITPINERIDPKFRNVNDQVKDKINEMEEKEEEKKDNKFIDEK